MPPASSVDTVTTVPPASGRPAPPGNGGPNAPARRIRHAIAAALLVGIAVTAGLGGWGHALAASAAPSTSSVVADSEAAVTVAGLTSTDTDLTTTVPSDFLGKMGYRPLVEALGGTGELVNPRGGCSSPFGSTRFDFDLACKHHDLGYDVLRYAARSGRPLGPSARQAIDRRFGTDLAARCTQIADAVPNRSRRLLVGTECQASALVYLAGVDINSWRQGWGTPGIESGVPWVAAGGMGLVAAVVAALVLTGYAGHRSNPRANPLESAPRVGSDLNRG